MQTAERTRFTEAEMATVRDTDLPDLLISLGYQVKRIGRYYTTQEMDSIRIKDRRTWFRYSEGIGGDAITFLQRFYNKSFPEAVEYLLTWHGRARDSPPVSTPRQTKEKVPFTLPPANVDHRRVFAYKRCTWARNGVKRIVWRCVSRLEFGKKYCHNSPSMAEDKLHTAILTVLNRVVEASDGLQDELAETLRMVCTPEGDGNNLMELERNMEALTTRQNTLLDQVLAHMDDLTLTEQLKALLEEKQHLQTRIDAAKKEAANRINEDSRMAELAAYLEEHLSGFQQYDDGIVRQLVERITVVDAETIRIKFRYSDVEIEQAMC